MDRARIGVVIHRKLRETLFSAEDQARLNGLGEVLCTESDDPISTSAACDLLKDCDIAVGSWQTPYPTAELLKGCPKLRLWEHAAGTVKHFFGPHLNRCNLMIASCKTAIADCVAEMVVGEIVLGLRRVFENAAENRKGPCPKPERLKVLLTSTVGVIGASEVGKRVVRLLRPFGCRILVYDPYVTEAQAREMGVALIQDLPTLCAQSDAVTLHTPNTPACYHLLGAQEFQAMQDDAVFINSARGDCIDETALIAELEKGRLTAFLDVSSPEPAAKDSPLRSLPNVIYTSHIAGPPSFHIGKQAVDDVAAFLQGKRPLCVVTADQLDTIA